jgi:hypothetical protein
MVSLLSPGRSLVLERLGVTRLVSALWTGIWEGTCYSTELKLSWELYKNCNPRALPGEQHWMLMASIIWLNNTEWQLGLKIIYWLREIQLSDKDKHWLRVNEVGGGGVGDLPSKWMPKAGRTSYTHIWWSGLQTKISRDNDGSLHMNTEKNPSRENNNS